MSKPINVRPGEGTIFRLINKRPPTDRVKYPSVPTRSVSLQGFLGGAEINEVNAAINPMPHDENEDLQARFNSGCNRNDLPSCFGAAIVERNLGPIALSLSDEIKSWVRKRGEIL